jgi:hypothetical protein
MAGKLRAGNTERIHLRSESYSGQGTQEKTFKPGREQVLKKRCFFTAEVAEGR